MVDYITEEANPGVVGSSWTDVFWDFLCGLFYDTYEEISDVGTKTHFVLNATARNNPQSEKHHQVRIS